LGFYVTPPAAIGDESVCETTGGYMFLCSAAAIEVRASMLPCRTAWSWGDVVVLTASVWLCEAQGVHSLVCGQLPVT
jgi:hypothetical protein